MNCTGCGTALASGTAWCPNCTARRDRMHRHGLAARAATDALTARQRAVLGAQGAKALGAVVTAAGWERLLAAEMAAERYRAEHPQQPVEPDTLPADELLELRRRQAHRNRTRKGQP